jgi:membrane-associated protease RseP (regulator of RpoE activity)
MSRRNLLLILGAILLIAAAALVYASVSNEKGKRAFLGVVLDEVTEKAAAKNKIEAGHGALVTMVTDDSPAEKAGLRAKDIIVKFDGTPVDSPDDLRRMLREKKCCDVVQLGVIRKGEEKTIEAILGERESAKRIVLNLGDDEGGIEWVMPDVPDIPDFPKRAFAGVHLQELTEGLAKYFGVEHGVLISDVEKESPAEKAGILAGDIICCIDGEKTESTGEVQSLIRDHEPGEMAKFEIVRRGEKLTIEVELGEKSDGWGCLDLYGLGMGTYGTGCRIYSDKKCRELFKDHRCIRQKTDPNEVWEKSYEYKLDLQPQLDELKAQLKELQKEMQRLREQEFQRQKM